MVGKGDISSGGGEELQAVDNVRVCVRVRPENGSGEGTKVVFVDGTNNSVVVDCKPTAKVFSYDHVLDTTSSQEQVFERIGIPMVEGCLRGYNGTIFAYGQTGSGKTHTMQGIIDVKEKFLEESAEEGEEVLDAIELREREKGLMPRVFQHLFEKISQLSVSSSGGGSVSFLVKCSFLEIYNENIADLLNPASQHLALREDIKKGVYVESLQEEVIRNSTEASRWLLKGIRNRHIGATLMNSQSSRSHTVFALTVQRKETSPEGICNIRHAKLNLIDLAGSERQKRTEAAGARLKEACVINKSLSTLGNVIRALTAKKASSTSSSSSSSSSLDNFVPYRDSKLTHLLKDSLGGNSKTTIIATIASGDSSFAETLSTLKFAQRAKLIRNKAVVNVEGILSSSASSSASSAANALMVSQLQSEVKRLQEELQRGGTGSGLPYSGASPPVPVSDRLLALALEREDETRQEMAKLQSRIEDLELLSRRKDQALLGTRALLQLRESTLCDLVHGCLSSSDSGSIPLLSSSLKMSLKRIVSDGDSTIISSSSSSSSSSSCSLLIDSPGKTRARTSPLDLLEAHPDPDAEEEEEDKEEEKDEDEEFLLFNATGRKETKENEKKKKSPSLRELELELEALRRQVRHHPLAVEFFIRNQELEELVQSYEVLFGDELAEHTSKVAKLQQYVTALSDQLRQSLAEKQDLQQNLDDLKLSLGTPSRSSSLLGTSKLSPLNGSEVSVEDDFDLRKDSMLASAQEELERVTRELEKTKEQSLRERAIHQQTQISSEAELNAAHVLIEELEGLLRDAQEAQSQLLERNRRVLEELDLSNEIRVAQDHELVELREAASRPRIPVSSPEDVARIAVLTRQLQASEEDRTRLEKELRVQEQGAREMRTRLASSEQQKRRLSESFGRAGGGRVINSSATVTSSPSSSSSRLPSSNSSGDVSTSAPDTQAQAIAKMLASGAEETCRRQGRRINELEAKLLSKKQKLASLREELGAVREENDTLQDEARYRSEQTRLLELEVSDLKSRLLELEKVAKETEGSEETERRMAVEELRHQATKWEREAAELQQRLQERDRLTLDLQSLVDFKDGEVLQLRTKVEEMRNRVEEADYLSLRSQELQQQLEVLSAENEEMEQQMVGLRQETELLRSSEKKLAAETEKLRSQVTVLQGEMRKLTDENGRLGGHANLRQKIHHHARVKEENTLLRKELGILNALARKADITAGKTEDFLDQLIPVLRQTDSHLASLFALPPSSSLGEEKENQPSSKPQSYNVNVVAGMKELRTVLKQKEKEAVALSPHLVALRAQSKSSSSSSSVSSSTTQH